MSRTAQAIWVQFGLLQLKESVLYLQSLKIPPRQSSTWFCHKVWLGKRLTKFVMAQQVPIWEELTLKKMSARFGLSARPGLT